MYLIGFYTLVVVVVFIPEIRRLLWESGRFGLYTGDSQIIWEGCHTVDTVFHDNKI